MELFYSPGVMARASIEAGTRQIPIFGVGIGFIVFISITMAIRMYVRVVIIKAVGADDILMLIGTLLTFGLTIASMLAAYYGTGKHIADIADEDYIPMLQAIWTTRFIYVLGIMFVKLSLLWFYLRLDQRGFMKWAVYTTTFIVLGLSIAGTFVDIFACIPPSKYWDVAGTMEGKCMSTKSQQVFFEAHGALTIVTDIMIYLTPIPTLWRVKINKRKKIGLLAIFGLGILSIVAGGVRYSYVKQLEGAKDQFYLLADSLNWCGIEVYVGIFCGCAPALSVFLRTYAPRIFGSTGRSGYRSYGVSYGDQPLHRLGPHSKHTWAIQRGEEPTISNGSQEAIVPNDGIMMKTDVHLEVGPSSIEDGQGGHSQDVVYPSHYK